ncbi:50S ribosomal protein L6 [Candidatus Parcubacteria bacterium]|nr:MAG: 50S ribosomal protein L6 [Candidatus Parcubacteria bacterium]
MSNIGKKPVEIKEGAEVKVEKNKVIVTGPKGALEVKIPEGISIEIKDNKVFVKKESEKKELEKFFGMMRAVINNMVTGVTSNFEKKLELSGVGYRARVEGRDLILNVGFANPVRITPPEGIEFKVEENVIIVKGASKEIVGDVADKIRGVRPPDPYKAKGIKYVGEIVRRKVGKAAKAVGGK